jgi:tripartite-type tricarboxylate transporter receptor subunit TctC
MKKETRMNPVFRRCRRMALAALALTATLGLQAQPALPVKPVRLVVPFPAGNTADIVGRLLADKLRAGLGQPVIVENRAGAAGIIGVDSVAKAEKDGHTLLLTTASPIVINPAVYRQLPYNVERDLLPIGAVSSQPMVLLANKSVPANNVKELVQYLQHAGNKASYASVGPGTFSHLAMETFAHAVDVQPLHVPYKGASAAITDVIGGQVALMFDGLASGSAQHRSGRVKAIAVTSLDRSPFLPDVPTVAESGIRALKNFEVSAWVGLFAPAGTPQPVIQRIHRELDKVLSSPEFRSQLQANSMLVAQPGTPERFAQQVRLDTAKWSRAAREAKLTPFE